MADADGSATAVALGAAQHDRRRANGAGAELLDRRQSLELACPTLNQGHSVGEPLSFA